MNVIFLLIFFGLILAGSFLFAFFKAVNNGQFSDCQSPAHRILFDEDKPLSHQSKLNNNGEMNESE